MLDIITQKRKVTMDIRAMLKETLLGDLDRELKVTRKVLERVPDDQLDWKPHEKSMSLGKLAIHVADITNWLRVTLDQDALEFENAEMPPEVRSRAELLAFFDKSAERVRASAAAFDLEKLNGTWAMKNGGQVIASKPRPTVIRVWCMNHMVHHRAQVCLYLRMLNVPVPAVYFNSADEPDWVFE
jgi:uncharacterized damage-inducible protein DinB